MGMVMANSKGFPLYWVISFLLSPVVALPFPLVSGAFPGASWSLSPPIVYHAASVNATASSSIPDPDHGPSPKEIGAGLGIVCACFLGSFLGLYFFWKRPRDKPQPYRQHVPLSARLRQTFSSLVLRTRRRFSGSSQRNDFSHGPSWLPEPAPARPCELPSPMDWKVPSWRLSLVSPMSTVSTAPLLPAKAVSVVGVAELSSSPMVPCTESPATLSIPTFLLPPSPTHVVGFNHDPTLSEEREPCISRFSATTVDTSSLCLPASRTSMVTTTTATSAANGGSASYGSRGAPHALNPYLTVDSSKSRRASIATFATATTSTSSTSTALVPPAPSRLHLASEATLIRTPERAARLVSLRRLRRVRSDSICRSVNQEAEHEQEQKQLQQPQWQQEWQQEYLEQERQWRWRWHGAIPDEVEPGEVAELEAGWDGEYSAHAETADDESLKGGRRSRWLGRSRRSLPEVR